VLSLCIFGFFSGPGLADCANGSAASLTLKSGNDEIATLSLADLDSLDQHSFQTTTQWTEGMIEFSGPALSTVLAKLKVPYTDTPVRLVAANRYSVVLPAEVVTTDTPILATRRNGCTFGVRDLGPLWVVFPYDADRKYRTEQIYAASIWQLVEIQIDP
jgi:hypothetical protein